MAPTSWAIAADDAPSDNKTIPVVRMTASKPFMLESSASGRDAGRDRSPRFQLTVQRGLYGSERAVTIPPVGRLLYSVAPSLRRRATVAAVSARAEAIDNAVS